MARVAASLQPNERDGTRTVTVLAAVIAALYFGSEILVPIALAILLSFVLAPMVRQLHRLGLGRVAPVFITVVFAFVLIASLGGLIATQMRDLATDLPRYEATVARKIQTIKAMSTGASGLQRIEDVFVRLGKAVDRTPQREADGKAGESAPGPRSQGNDGVAAQPPLPVEIVKASPTPFDTLSRLAAPLLHPLATAGIVLVFVIFILLQRSDLRNRAIRLFGATDLQRTTAAIDDGAKRLSRYLLVQCVINASAGLLLGVALWIIGVPSPVLIGIVFACARFVPYVGAVLGAVLPVTLAAAVDPGWSMVAWTVGVVLGSEALIGQGIEPVAFGHNTGLSPIAVVIAATFWTVLWGPVGLFLSTPLTVCLVVLGRHVEQLAFLDVLLGDQPPLSPSELFYQRMLARDPIEASDLARRCLNEMSVADYYDTVVMPALLLAQDDVDQDRLDMDRQTEIAGAAAEVIEDLGDEDTADEPQKVRRRFWRFGRKPEGEEKAPLSPDDLLPDTVPDRFRAPNSVLCVGARGPLDDVAAAMLAQVFKSHDVGATMASYASLTKTAIDALDVKGVSLICVSALDGGSAAYLRFVLRRLRRHAPQAQVLLGTWWRREGRRDSDEEIDAAVKDEKVATFVDALRFCLSQDQVPGRTASGQAPLAAVR